MTLATAEIDKSVIIESRGRSSRSKQRSGTSAVAPKKSVQPKNNIQNELVGMKGRQNENIDALLKKLEKENEHAKIITSKGLHSLEQKVQTYRKSKQETTIQNANGLADNYFETLIIEQELQ